MLIRYAGDAARGASLTAWVDYASTCLGACAVGEPGRTANMLGQDVAQNLLDEMSSDATVDLPTAENLMLWVALLGGHFRVSRMTEALQTVREVIEQFLPGSLHVRDN